MDKTPSKQKPSELLLQVVVVFVLPLVILTRLSGEQALGPVKSLLLALSLPVLYELYSVYKRRKVSIISVVAIVGVLVTGALGLLQVSAVWLALRRSILYVFIAAALLISLLVKKPLVSKFAERLLDTAKIEKEAKKRKNQEKIQKLYRQATLWASALFLVVGVSSFIITKKTVVSPPKSAAYNQQYAKLRLYSIAAVTVPVVAGSTLIMLMVLLKLEKLTGLEAERMTKL